MHRAARAARKLDQVEGGLQRSLCGDLRRELRRQTAARELREPLLVVPQFIAAQRLVHARPQFRHGCPELADVRGDIESIAAVLQQPVA